MRLATYTASDVRKTLFDASGVSEDEFSEDGKAMVHAIISWAATPEGEVALGLVPSNLRMIARWLTVTAETLEHTA